MKRKYLQTIFLFWIPFLMLLTISLFLMYHAKFITNTFEHHFEKQLLWFGVGFFFFIIFHFVSTKPLFRYSFLFYVMNVFLLILVLKIGKNINGATAWIDFHYFSFQPSELMKLSLALFLANFVPNKKFKNWKEELWFLGEILFFTLLPSIFVFLEPDTGAIVFYFFLMIVALWNSNLRKRWFLVIGFCLFLLLGTFFYCYFFQKDFLISIIGTSFFYRVERLFSLGSGMQIENAKIALGSAPWFRFSILETGIYIPEAPTDFVFSLTANVFGLFGNILILFSYFLLDFYFLSFQKKEKRKEKKLFVSLFLILFIGSQLINIAMNLGLFPIIGIPLPFLSYGGSSTIVLFLFLGIIFSRK